LTAAQGNEEGEFMTRKALLVTLALTTCVAGLVASAGLAITGGETDTVHKNVGVVRFTTSDGRFRCSGSRTTSGALPILIPA
jgi:hypothetical protein